MRIKDKICPFCDDKISTITHLKKCNKNVDEITSFKLMIEKTFNCVSEEVLNDYLTGLSLPDIKEKYGYVIIYLWEWDINECLKNKTINEFLLSNLIYGG